MARSARVELAWAAGFYDGEGSTFIKSHGPNKRWIQINMTISQTEPTTLERFQSAVGAGRIHGPYTSPSKGLHKPRWQWHIEGPDRCSDVLKLLWPYLSEPKRRQADAVIERYLQYREDLTYRTLDGTYPWTLRRNRL